MQRQRQKDTSAEIAIRSLLHQRGFRYRVNYPLPGLRRRADIAFLTERVAVMVDGCFWHGCPDHGTWPKANAEWWREKIQRNMQRDRDTNRILAAAGWVVVRIWEHEEPIDAADSVVTALLRHRVGAGPRIAADD